MADDVDFQTPRWQREVVRTETGRLTPTLPRNIPTLHQLASAAFWPTPPWWETGKWFKEAMSPRDNAPYDLILEKQRSPESDRYLRNPMRWNPFQWRVAYKNIRPTRHGKIAVVHNYGFFGFGRCQSVCQEGFFGSERTEAICQDVVNAARTEMGIKLGWINGADVNLMLPTEWMSLDAVNGEADPNQRLLGTVQAEERREHREEEEPVPQRRRVS